MVTNLHESESELYAEKSNQSQASCGEQFEAVILPVVYSYPIVLERRG
jgi:hypothetical protein